MGICWAEKRHDVAHSVTAHVITMGRVPLHEMHFLAHCRLKTHHFNIVHGIEMAEAID